MAVVAPARFDVVIIGSGPTGATYARTVVEEAPGASVLLVEAGPQVSTPPGRHVKNILDPEARVRAQLASQGPTPVVYPTPTVAERAAAAAPGGDRSLLARPGTFVLGDGARLDGEDGLPAAAMSSNVGGMGAHWTCACPRPGAGEWIEDIPRAELEEAFVRAEELLEVTSTAFANAPFGADVRRILGEIFDEGRQPARRVQPMPLAVSVAADGTRSWSGADVVLGPLAAGPVEGFELRAGTRCVRVLHTDGVASGVELRDVATGDDTVVEARHVVVAADTLRTPQLLFASGIRPPALGRYLNDQHQILSAVRLSDDVVAGVPPAPAPTAGIDPTSGVSWVPYDAPTHPFHGQVMQLDASPVELPEDDAVAAGSIVGLGWFTAKDLQASDRVEFSDVELDSAGMPAMRIHYTLTDADHEMIRRATDAAITAGKALGTPLVDEPPTLLPLGSSLHYQGTVRLGAVDDGTSVCDTYSRVWGTANVYVAGNGVIPTSTACNPTLTSVALAVRGARRIAEQLAVR